MNMSKQLLVMRHAKSSWSGEGLSDFERPLNKRGMRVTPQVANFIHDQGLTPDWLVSSSATRAKMTAELFAENCQGVLSQQIQLVKSFYHASSSVYLEFLKSFSDESVATLMFVGHNPGLEDLVERLSGDWHAMPTAAVAYFDLKSETWSGLGSPITATLKHLWRPKEIGIK
jgi:phosphohistidine phosphatase